MSNLIPLEEAARLLGLPVDKLNEMRSNSEIFGYKDGSSWKFKMQELERVADELDITINVGASRVPESVQSLDDFDDDDAFELSVDDDDLSFELNDSSADFLRDDDSADVAAAGDDDSDELRLEGDDQTSSRLADDELEIDDEFAAANSGELSFGSSDIHLAADDDASAVDLLDDDEPSRGDPSTGKVLADEDGDDMLLSEDDLFEDELTIHESSEDSADLSSDFDDSSDIIMDDSSSAEVDALVAADEEDSSEVVLSQSSLMDLAADDDDEMIVLEDAGDPARLQDDDFNLTPLEAAEDDDESSGSQIIALDDSELYSDESAATLLSPSDEISAEPMLTGDPLDVSDFGGFEMGVPGLAPGLGGYSGSGQLPEEPYSTWQIASLALVLFLLLIGGMIGYDLARNLWLPEDQLVSSGVLKFILSLVGL